MNNEQTPGILEIDVVEPLSRSWEHMKSALFPFNFGRWFTLGFVAFVATLGSMGGGFNFQMPGRFGKGFGPSFTPPFGRGFQGTSRNPGEMISGWIQEHLPLVIVLGAVGLALVLALMVLFAFLKSRMTFVYLHNVHGRRVEVARPWREMREIGNSYFIWRLVLALASFFIFLSIAGVLFFLIGTSLLRGEFHPEHVGLLILAGLACVPLFILIGLAHWALDALIAPIMYLRNVRAGEAWRLLRGLFRRNRGAFLLFWLMNIVLGILHVALAAAATLCTCCIGALPVIHQTVLQPFLYWFRGYPLFFLAQFGPEYPAPPSAADSDAATRPSAAPVISAIATTPPPQVGVCPSCGQQHAIPDGKPGLYSCVKCGATFEVK